MRPTFSITHAEYTQRRSSFELCQWINQKLAEMRETGRFDELYFERNDPQTRIKKLIEEAIPLSRLGLYLATPGSEVYLTCFDDNRNRDAVVEVTGFNARTFRVEVTTTETKASTIRRQALSCRGHVHLTGTMTKKGREISSTGGMICADEEDERCIDLMFERFRRKVESGRYDADTAILVFFTDFRAIDPAYRAKLVSLTERYLLERQVKVSGAYYCYTADYCIDRVGRTAVNARAEPLGRRGGPRLTSRRNLPPAV